MSITIESELVGMKKVSDVVAYTLKEMKDFAKPGISTKQLDDLGAKILKGFGANSAPYKTYQFPGWTCISVNKEFCHGIGRSLHEEPSEIANYKDPFNLTRFKKNSVVAIETFISTHSKYAVTLNDGWTMVGNKGGFMAQHEHTIKDAS